MPRDLALSASFATADDIVRSYHQRGGQPAIAYGIVRDGELVHAAGFGARSLGGPPPDERTVFRIASMSKSFTASAIMLLRDEGMLALDDPASAYLPQLAGWDNGAADAGPLTIRHLLTMTAGFPTDDPWGDRQQGLPLAEFDALLAHGVGFNWAPGTRFEYSNLGYAILGRIVAAAAGVPYDEFVRNRLLTPLSMSRTGFAAEEFPGSELALGYRRGQDGWQELPFDPYGAFAPMGGVFSCVADLATWASGFAAAFRPVIEARLAESDCVAGAAHPLAADSRRLMQLPQAVTGWRAADRLPGAPPGSPAYYGFGLFIDEDPALGRIVSHSGGYPGFGSNMRWHPPTGLAVIALGNGTYARMNAVAELVLGAVLPPAPGYQVALSPGAKPWPETLAAQESVSRLLLGWDDAAADALFCENVALDKPYQERLADLALLRERIGDFAPDTSRPAQSDTPAHRRWWLTGEGGTVAVAIQLNPQRPPRVQSLGIAVPPAPGSPLAKTLTALVAWLNDPAAAWPATVPVAPAADAGLIARRLRMAAVWAGQVTSGAFQAGDGSSSATVELSGEHATANLAVLINPVTGELRQADIAV
ncbi:serine hydrolase domain-containing protein [Trebonia kvetii]|uniref:serine hydrolase domain-containing protein n=1 Tax=Trebonia kvetii TaxID=2480626 RepID=UPI001652335C|nr:serine hydrolase domain-containing protein [Trebonia kvetii]